MCSIVTVTFGEFNSFETEEVVCSYVFEKLKEILLPIRTPSMAIQSREINCKQSRHCYYYNSLFIVVQT
jgi:hypothetical protein